jgi:hypothetical protein
LSTCFPLFRVFLCLFFQKKYIDFTVNVLAGVSCKEEGKWLSWPYINKIARRFMHYKRQVSFPTYENLKCLDAIARPREERISVPKAFIMDRDVALRLIGIENPASTLPIKDIAIPRRRKPDGCGITIRQGKEVRLHTNKFLVEKSAEWIRVNGWWNISK